LKVSPGGNIPGKSERSPLLARRGVCGEAADGVVDQDPEDDSLQPTDERQMQIVILLELSEYEMNINPVIEPPPRRFAPPLLTRRGDCSDLPGTSLPPQREGFVQRSVEF